MKKSWFSSDAVPCIVFCDAMLCNKDVSKKYTNNTLVAVLLGESV
jgi:hypothetical protein